MSTEQHRPVITYIDQDGYPVEAPRKQALGGHGPRAQFSPGITVSAGAVHVTAAPQDIGAAGDAGADPDLLAPAWRAGMLTGAGTIVLALLMMVLTSGLLAVVVWPLAAFTLVMGVSLIGGTIEARRNARRKGLTGLRAQHTPESSLK
ncbi:hypothetical protein [Actinomyces oricola]